MDPHEDLLSTCPELGVDFAETFCQVLSAVSPPVPGEFFTTEPLGKPGTASDDARESVFIFIIINGLISIDFFGKVVWVYIALFAMYA